MESSIVTRTPPRREQRGHGVMTHRGGLGGHLLSAGMACFSLQLWRTLVGLSQCALGTGKGWEETGPVSWTAGVLGGRRWFQKSPQAYVSECTQSPQSKRSRSKHWPPYTQRQGLPIVAEWDV